jgi:hypothetical protein
MASASTSAIPLSPAELEDRLLAVENTIGTLRIEGMDPDGTTLKILARYSGGQIEFSETKRLLREYSRTLL